MVSCDASSAVSAEFQWIPQTTIGDAWWIDLPPSLNGQPVGTSQLALSPEGHLLAGIGSAALWMSLQAYYDVSTRQVWLDDANYSQLMEKAKQAGIAHRGRTIPIEPLERWTSSVQRLPDGKKVFLLDGEYVTSCDIDLGKAVAPNAIGSGAFIYQLSKPYRSTIESCSGEDYRPTHVPKNPSVMLPFRSMQDVYVVDDGTLLVVGPFPYIIRLKVDPSAQNYVSSPFFESHRDFGVVSERELEDLARNKSSQALVDAIAERLRRLQN
jgi:hypothetical protein